MLPLHISVSNVFECGFLTPKKLKYRLRLHKHAPLFSNTRPTFMSAKKKHFKRKSVVIDLFVSAKLGHSWHRRT